MAAKTLDLTVPHQLGKAEARRRVESGIHRLRAEHGERFARVEEQWTGDRMDFAVSALGQRVSGSLEIEEEAVRVHVVLPWLLARLAEKLRPQIEQQTRRALELPPPK